jgi:hypothetical protein
MSRILVLTGLLFAALAPVNAFEPSLTFAADPTAARTALRDANDLVRFAHAELELDLDWRPDSLALVTNLVSELHADLRRDRGSLSDVDGLVRKLGSYVGEVYRRAYGGVWGFVEVRGTRRLALRDGERGALLWPIERVRQCVRGGAAAGVSAFARPRVTLAGDAR